MRVLRAVILGGGFGGRAVMAWLRRTVPPSRLRATVVSPRRDLPYRPDLVFAGRRDPGFTARLRLDVARIARRLGVTFVEDMAVRVDADRRRVQLLSGASLAYDVLFWATGAEPAWDAFPGATSELGLLCEDYGARTLALLAKSWEGGRIVLVEGPLLAGPGREPRLASALANPLYEWILLFLDGLTAARRSRTEVVLVTEAAVVGEALGPRGRDVLAQRLAAAGVATVAGVRLSGVEGRRLFFRDAQGGAGTLGADLLLWSPPYGGSRLAVASGLDDGHGWLPVDADFRHVRYPDVYVVGDLAQRTLPKLGHAAMVEARHAVHHWWAGVSGHPPPPPVPPRTLLLLHLDRGEALLDVHDTLWGGEREWVCVGRWPAVAKRLFGWAYRLCGGDLPILP